MRIEDARAAIVLLQPTRSRILAELRRPSSATEVARRLKLPAARVNHHFRELRSAGLIRRAALRRVRNLTEILYVSLARTFVIAEKLTPGGDRRAELRADSSRRGLRNLAALGERLFGDALVLLDEAACDDKEFSTYATSLDLAFPDAASRAAFLADLLEAVRSLREKYGSGKEPAPEERYKTVIACYPG
jgi:DNA-binding transcriptional ArsR family regulator